MQHPRGAQEAPKFKDFILPLSSPNGYAMSSTMGASLILKGHFPDRDMRQDYFDLIAELVRANPGYFHPGTHYRKVLKLYERWQEHT